MNISQGSLDLSTNLMIMFQISQNSLSFSCAHHSIISFSYRNLNAILPSELFLKADLFSNMVLALWMKAVFRWIRYSLSLLMHWNATLGKLESCLQIHFTFLHHAIQWNGSYGKYIFDFKKPCSQILSASIFRTSIQIFQFHLAT